MKSHLISLLFRIQIKIIIIIITIIITLHMMTAVSPVRAGPVVGSTWAWVMLGAREIVILRLAKIIIIIIIVFYFPW